MKKAYIFLFIIFMFIASCGNKITAPTETINGITYYDTASSETKEFPFIQADSLGNYHEIRAKFSKLLESSHTIVYLQDGYNIQKDKVISFFTEFENNYEKTIEIYGNHSDIDGNGKIIFLMAELNINPGGSVLNGYFSANDIIEGKDGVRGEFLHIDAVYIDDTTMGFIMHEFQHLINYNVNILEGKKEPDIWFNEMLSESTSYIFSEALVTRRKSLFNNSPYYSFYSWYTKYDNDEYVFQDNSSILISYGSSSIFMNWLNNRSGGNYEIFKEIAHSDPSLTSEQRVINSINKFSLNIGNNLDDIMLNWIEGLSNRDLEGVYVAPASSLIFNPIPLMPKAVIICNTDSVQNIERIKTMPISKHAGYSAVVNTSVNKNAGYVSKADIININIPKKANLNSSTKYIPFDLSVLKNGTYFIDRVFTENDKKLIN